MAPETPHGTLSLTMGVSGNVVAAEGWCKEVVIHWLGKPGWTGPTDKKNRTEVYMVILQQQPLE